MSTPLVIGGLVGLGILASRKKKPSGFWDSLPEKLHDPEPQRRLMDAVVQRGDFRWFPITISGKLADGRRASVTLQVSNAVKVDGVRVSNLLYDNAQRVADRLGLILPTMKVADLVHRSATVHFPPAGSNAGMRAMQAHVKAGTNVTKRATLEHDGFVEEAVAGQGGLADNEGKWFVLSPGHWSRPRRSGTYGWWNADGSIVHGINHLFAHELTFADYSQALRYLKPTATVRIDGGEATTMPVSMLYTDPLWAGLVSSEGALPGSRHPGVVEVA